MGISKETTSTWFVVLRFLINKLKKIKGNDFRFNEKDKKSDPVISDELSKPRPWVSKTPMKM
jgi:hypothetical protein